jgi:thermitase
MPITYGTDEISDYVEGHLLIVVAGDDDTAVDAALSGQGATKTDLGGKVRLLQLPDHASATALQALIEHNPHFANVELDRAFQAAAVTDDTLVGAQWHIAKIGAPAAWDTSFGAGIKIGIIDTGVNAAHADLAANMVAGYNFFANTSNTDDDWGHGTMVAGVAAAVANNATGVAGVAGAATIVPLKVTDAAGVGYWSAMVSAINYARTNGCRVVNLSFENMPLSDSISSACAAFKTAGGLAIVAGGNSNSNPGHPVRTSMIPVSGTDVNDFRYQASSYGTYILLSAPALGITTTVRTGGYTQSAQGTSFASPIVAGVAALMMAAKPALTPAQIESILFSTAKDLGTAYPGKDIYYGWGRVDAAAAVAAALNASAPPPTSTEDSTAPVVTITAPTGTTVSGKTAAIKFTATDNAGTAGLRLSLYIDGALKASGTGGSLSYTWQLRKVAAGTHTIECKAIDAANNFHQVFKTVTKS